MSRILIMGDSWACGEWDHHAGRYQVVHPGTQRYLSDAGHSVTSIAEGGSSNWAQLDRLQPHHAMSEQLRGQDLVLWFLTDPLRDLESLGQPQPHTQAGFQAQRRELLAESRRVMRHTWSGPVWLVGGVEPVPAGFTDGMPGWRRVCADWIRWLVPEAQVRGDYLNRGWRYPECEAPLLDQHEQGEEQAHVFRWRAENRTRAAEHRWFWPDGSHPNREAHRRLTQELILPLL